MELSPRCPECDNRLEETGVTSVVDTTVYGDFTCEKCEKRWPGLL